jgi:hypothetical protein
MLGPLCCCRYGGFRERGCRMLIRRWNGGAGLVYWFCWRSMREPMSVLMTEYGILKWCRYPFDDDAAEGMAYKYDRAMRRIFELPLLALPYSCRLILTSRSATSSATRVCACCKIRSEDVFPRTAVTAALYPNVKMRAHFKLLGTRSLSFNQNFFVLSVVQVLKG